METVIIFFLTILLTVAVCQFFNAKAKTTVILAFVAAFAFAAFVFATIDVIPVFKTFGVWVAELWSQITGG